MPRSTLETRLTLIALREKYNISHDYDPPDNDDRWEDDSRDQASERYEAESLE